MPPYYESAAYVAAPADSAHATSPPLAPGPRRPIGGSPRLEAARGRLPRRLKRLRELVLPGAFQTPLGHRGPSLSSPGQRRALGAHRAPRRPHDQLAARPAPADSSPGASARRRALGPRRVVRATGRGGACCEGSDRPGRWGRRVGRPARLGRSLRRRTALYWGCRPLGGAPPPGAGSRRHRRLRGRRHLPLRQPLRRSIGASSQHAPSPPPELVWPRHCP